MRFTTFAASFFICIVLWGCKSSTSTDSLENFSADLNGKHWVPQKKVYGINDTTAKEIWISAMAPDSTTMWIFIDSLERTPGTYENSHGIFVAGGYNDHGRFNSFYWYSGELNISAISLKHATGTFNFKANRGFPGADTVTVTNGKFDVDIYYGIIPL